MLSTLLLVVLAFGSGALLVRHRGVQPLREQLHYYQERDGVGDLSLEGEVRQLRRRITGLLNSPGTYLRARRLMGTLDLTPEELTAELELIEITT